MEKHDVVVVGGGHNGLIVAAYLAKAGLENKNYQVSAAFDGNESLQKAQDEKPDPIILDIIMPTKDGFTVCEQLKGEPQLSKIPVIILTSFAEKGKETNIPSSAGLTLEAEDYIDKPVSPAVFQCSLFIHDATFIIAICMFFLHFQLGVFHPRMDESLLSMVDGKVSGVYAKSHHGLWYDKIAKKKDSSVTSS